MDVKPPPGEVGTPYTFQFFGEEGCLPYRFSYLNGTVPPGLRITEDGKLTGTPTEAGAFNFWVVGLDDSVDCMSMQSQGEFTMIVMPDLAVTTASLRAAVSGAPYSAQLQFSNPEVGWPVIWDITQGTLPGGLTLSEGGLISGTPTGPDAKTFVVRAREPFRRFGERQLTLTVAAALQAKAPSLHLGRVGVRFASFLSAIGGFPPLTWSVASGTLPRGLSLNATGTIRGIPGAAGAFALTVAVTDAAGQRSTSSATIRILGKLKITTRSLTPAVAGRAYRAQLDTSGLLRFGFLRWRIVRGSLLQGIRLERGTGILIDTPRRAGTYRFTVRAIETAGGMATKALVLVVRP